MTVSCGGTDLLCRSEYDQDIRAPEEGVPHLHEVAQAMNTGDQLGNAITRKTVLSQALAI